MVKWQYWICLTGICLTLSACGRTNADEAMADSFHLSKQEEEQYAEEIENTMNAMYWRYDDTTLTYGERMVPAKDGQAAEIFEASRNSGFDLEKHAGKTAVVATADLIHFNGEKAGIAYFYFQRHNLIGVYYTVAGNEGHYYGLRHRNVFIGDVVFSNYETDTPMADFQQETVSFPSGGFCAIGRSPEGTAVLAAIEGEAVEVYTFEAGRGLRLTRTIRTAPQVPIAATFYNGGLAVLVGNTFTSGEGEGEASYTESDKVMFYDGAFRKEALEIPLSAGSYSCIFASADEIILMNDKIMEYYGPIEGGFEKKSQFFMDHRITAFTSADLDGDGTEEYLMTDGMDLFLYHKSGIGFRCLWKTHLSIDNLDSHIYTGDLNQDGVKEIYIGDITGTSIRYVLTKEGLMSRNEDVSYGERFFAGDLNGDGKDDYIKMEDIENQTQNIYIAK